MNNQNRAELEQQNYYEYFGDRDWDLYCANEHVFLKQSVGFALFGPPSEKVTEQNETGYTSDQNKEINAIYELVRKNNFVRDERSIFVRIIYICWNGTHENGNIVGRTPVFVLKKCVVEPNGEEIYCETNCKIFIDRSGRVYDDWVSYLNNNKHPDCVTVCPKNGKYSGRIIDNQPQVLLEYHESVTCGINFKAPGIIITVVGVPTGYMIGRTDQQSESPWSWFATASKGSFIEIPQISIINMVAQKSYNILKEANMFGSWKPHKETITPLVDIFQFSASLLFFYRSVVDFQTAERLISKTQKNTLQNYNESLRSNKSRKVFAKAVKETERLNEKMRGRAEVISGINNITDKNSFFTEFARVNKDVNNVGALFEITADGNVRINSAHIIDPNEFSSMNQASRTDILDNLPSRQITVTYRDFIASRVVVNDNLQSLGEFGSNIASDLIVSLIRNNGNGDSFAMLVSNFAKETVRKLFRILYQLLDEIQNRFEDFDQTYPCAPVAVGAMQYLINYLKYLARNIEANIDEFINYVFNEDGTLNSEFLQILVSSFHLWLDEKLECFQRSRAIASINLRVRERKSCNKCNGYYYVK